MDKQFNISELQLKYLELETLLDITNELNSFENVEQDLAHCARFQVVELLAEKREQGILQLFMLLGVMKSSGWFLLGHVEAAGVVEAAEGALLGRCWL